MSKPKAIFCWSGGKDSAFALHKVLSEGTYDVKYLLTTVNKQFRRISMHGIREELLDAQVASIGIPLIKILVSEGTNAEYEQLMGDALLKAKAEGIEHIIFGDIFLDDLRAYREANLSKSGFTAVFPLWKSDTRELVSRFIAAGFKTITTCISDGYLGEQWCGRIIDEQLVAELPDNVDPCGENGEYHTFCFDGPIFRQAIPFTIGEKTYRPLECPPEPSSDTEQPAVTTRGFWFCDLT